MAASANTRALSSPPNRTACRKSANPSKRCALAHTAGCSSREMTSKVSLGMAIASCNTRMPSSLGGCRRSTPAGSADHRCHPGPKSPGGSHCEQWFITRIARHVRLHRPRVQNGGRQTTQVVAEMPGRGWTRYTAPSPCLTPL